MKNILIIGNFGARNTGDELILRSILELVRSAGHRAWVISADPKATTLAYGVAAFWRLPMGLRSFLACGWLRTVRAFWRCDAVVFGGGGLFVDHFWRAPLLWGLHGLAAVALRKPLLLLGQSCELRGRFSVGIAAFLARRSRLITVRDRDSLSLLQRLAPEARIYLYPDMAFLSLLTCPVAPRKAHLRTLGVSLCRWGMEPADAAGDRKLALLAGEAERYDLVRLFAFQQGGDDDMKPLRALASKISGKPVEYVAWNDSQFTEKFISCDFAICMRFHACMMALACGMPFVGLAYQGKVRSGLETLGAGDRCVALDESFDQNFEAISTASREPIRTEILDLVCRNTYALRELLLHELQSL